MDVEERRSRHLHATLQRVRDVPKIVKALGAEQVDDEVSACAPDPISLDEPIFPVVVRYQRAWTMIFLLGGA
jgi:hypothetical protein